MAFKEPKFSIVIPCYNNIEILPKCFPTVMKLWSDNIDKITEIIIVDDFSTDSTKEFFQKNYPSVTLLTNTTNLGFAKSCFKGISSANNEWIILLNSDIQIISGIVNPLIEDLQKDPDLFAVSFASFHENGDKFEGRKFFIAKTGLYKTRNNFSSDEDRLYDSFYATGGHCLLSKKKFFELGGYSPVFEPFYWEDADISYRAMKRGWGVYFDPRCKVIHDHSRSIRTSNSKRKIDIIQTRNKIIFFWKNVSSLRLWTIHITGLLFRILTSWIAGDLIFYIAFFKALKKVSQIVPIYSAEKKQWKKDDWELFKRGKV